MCVRMLGNARVIALSAWVRVEFVQIKSACVSYVPCKNFTLTMHPEATNQSVTAGLLGQLTSQQLRRKTSIFIYQVGSGENNDGRQEKYPHCHIFTTILKN